MTRPLLRWPRIGWTLARTYGARGIVLRGVHELRRRTGAFRSAPRWSADLTTPPAAPFRVDPGALRTATDLEAARARADRVVAGEYQAFRWEWRSLPGSPADWLRHPTTGSRWRGDVPWWQSPDLEPGRGDIKTLWEPARFAWAYDLVRGYLLTKDDRYARAFHDRLADWLESSPPFRGPHWSCGQETAIRAAALLYAEANLAGARSSTAAARERLARVLAASGERIDDALGYGLSQRNNHGISESVGLILMGVRFRDRHPRAERWLHRGRVWLERLVREQFAEDGWYIQHSFNYLRLALDQCVLARRALETTGASFSEQATTRIDAAARLLAEVADPDSGVVPNYGHNDGALVHPISLAAYRDYRPTLTAVCASFGLRLPAPIPADREALAWLGAEAPVPGPRLGDGVRIGASGWAVARVGDAAVFLRAGRYRSRPAHIDPLHVDIRWGGREMVVDPGTFAYNAPPLRPAAASAAAHNGPRLEGHDAAHRGPRFLWLTWPEAEVKKAAWVDGVATLVAEAAGKVRRRVVVTPDQVRIEDRSLTGAPALEVRWLLHPDAVREQLVSRRLSVENGGSAGEGSRQDGATRGDGLERWDEEGWFSSHYERKEPAPAVRVRVAPAGAYDGVVTEVRAPRPGEGIR